MVERNGLGHSKGSLGLSLFFHQYVSDQPQGRDIIERWCPHPCPGGYWDTDDLNYTMCSSNRRYPSTPPGKGGDITFFPSICQWSALGSGHHWEVMSPLLEQSLSSLLYHQGRWPNAKAWLCWSCEPGSNLIGYTGGNHRYFTGTICVRL